MDRVAKGYPIMEIGDLYYFYVVLGEDDPKVVEDFMGYSYQTAKAFFRSFMVQYLETEDTDRIREVVQKASILSYSRKICKLCDKSPQTRQDREKIRQCLDRIKELTDQVDSLEF